MTHKQFSIAIDKINERLGTNILGVEHRKTQEFIMPINMFVSRDREGLKKVYFTLKKMVEMGYGFEQIKTDKHGEKK